MTKMQSHVNDTKRDGDKILGKIFDCLDNKVGAVTAIQTLGFVDAAHKTIKQINVAHEMAIKNDIADAKFENYKGSLNEAS